MKLTNQDVQDLLRLLDASGYDELNMQTDDYSLHLQRSGSGEWVKQEALTRQPQLATSQPQPEAVSATGTDSSGSQELEAGLIAVRAPLPGTFYRAPKPGAAPFVEEGSQVKSDSVIGIIETMKLMNSIYADQAGTIKEIRVQNGQVVDKDTILMTLVPEAS